MHSEGGGERAISGAGARGFSGSATAREACLLDYLCVPALGRPRQRTARTEIVYDDRSAHVNPLILNHVWRKRDSRTNLSIPTDPTGPNAAVQRTQFYRALNLAHVSSDVTGRL